MGVGSLLVYLFLFTALYVQIFLLITFLEYKSTPRRKTRGVSARLPTVTIIVPCFNEARTIYGTLRSLLALRYPQGKLEVLVVDDGSTDETASIAARFQKYRGVRVLRKENGGKYTALNFGLRHAQGELVGCLDADSFVEKEALMRIAGVFADRSVMAVTPAIKVRGANNFIEKIQHAEYTMGVFLRKMFGELNAIHVAPGPFSIFRREVFERIGEYRHAHQTEDLEMALRMHANRFRIENAADAFVYTTVPSTLGTLLRQRRRWIGGFLYNAYDYRRLFFRSRFGHIGTFTLPGGVIAILSACYLTLWSLYNGTTAIIGKFSNWNFIDFRLLRGGEMDLFYLYPRAATLLTLVLLSLGLVVVILSKRMADKNEPIMKHIVHFLFLYGFMAPVWILHAVGHVALRRKTAWK